MNTLHRAATSAVITRLHDVGRSCARTRQGENEAGAEKSGADGGPSRTSAFERGGGRGCARGTGRPRPPYMVAIDALGGTNGGNGGGNSGGATYGEATGGRDSATGGQDAEAAFTAYVQERRASLYATAYHLTGDRHEAEDLLQSALFSTYRAWDRITDKAALGGYLRRTMTNLHISAWRRRKLNEYPTEELPETAGDVDAMRGTELRAVLWQALARLPETQRTMLVLRYYEGRTDPEIADILGISVGTVKSSIWRSLRRLREDEVLSFGRDEEESFGELVA
ncbi:SigE family RNA polymerase sigma factor [Streptomyces sp. MST-110588]|uniref:SigE family RNA polymerase sigma factor n=1 Tax=Streptomyces sp. MST-110588 TaxID=2833628 RepID=UPI001F5C559D|nr:SigE family RNA polymerase sigma factor [Streptomyces sp. MST-110588]UNO40235.1 SigE family RNA polymerase sigma factor [Streptomyces sp. MST-110588]